MKVMETLTKLVIGMSRLGEHLLKRKVSGIIVAALAFACGAGLVYSLKAEPRVTQAVATAQRADPARAEVSMRDTSEAEEALFKGRYENYVYGYSVYIPDGMVGAGSTPPAPQHGFGINLDNPCSTAWKGARDFPKSYLYVDGSYNSLEWRWLDDAVAFHLNFLREKAENIRVQSRTLTRLGGLHAVRVVALYEEGGEEMVSDEVVAFMHKANGEASVIYTLDLSTPLSKYERDRPALEVLQKSWCLQPVR
jgi:hypothetical protein